MLQPRPPVVTIMGHVDHGKTTLLDKIRQTNVAGGESGGITQHIGAYQVEFKDKEKKSRKITFIDTPGHKAFAEMRARGARITDIAILVVAADEGVMEQTKESLAHIQNAKIPFLVALTKIDLPAAAADKAKSQLLEIGIIPEEYGGNITVVPVSAKTGEGVDELLEMIVLLGQVEDLKGDPDGLLEGVVVESSLDRRRGPVATVLIKNGTLKLREDFWVQNTTARVKAMFNDRGKPISVTELSLPVEILGFSDVPAVGSSVTAGPSGEEPTAPAKKTAPAVTDIFAKQEEKLALVIKSDAQGTLEAIINNLPADTILVYGGTGEITDSDIFLAQTSRALIMAFKVKTTPAAKRLAQDNKINIKTYEIIYELFDEIEREVRKMKNPEAERDIVGKAQIIAEFEIDKKRVAGIKVMSGEISRRLPVTIKRKEETLGETKIVTMKHLREDVIEAKQGQEFGATFSPYIDFKIGDDIISYKDKSSDIKE